MTLVNRAMSAGTATVSLTLKSIRTAGSCWSEGSRKGNRIPADSHILWALASRCEQTGAACASGHHRRRQHCAGHRQCQQGAEPLNIPATVHCACLALERILLTAEAVQSRKGPELTLLP